MAMLLAVRSCALEPVRLQSDSMAPTLGRGDWVLVDKLSDHWRAPSRGDIVTAVHPSTGEWIIKRVVATGGQSVGLDDGRLVVGGRVVVEPYANHSRMSGRYFGPITVPDGHVFLLGDNRDGSEDSRTFGPVPVSRLTGRMIVRIWSAAD